MGVCKKYVEISYLNKIIGMAKIIIINGLHLMNHITSWPIFSLFFALNSATYFGTVA